MRYRIYVRIFYIKSSYVSFFSFVEIFLKQLVTLNHVYLFKILNLFWPKLPSHAKMDAILLFFSNIDKYR